MINVAQAAIFGRQKKAPNTFIGGIAKTGGTGVNAPIDTIAKLATKLGIAENRISSFKINGDDVSCYIGGGTYSMSAFGSLTSANANKNITFLFSENGLIGIAGNCFANTTINSFTNNEPSIITTTLLRCFELTPLTYWKWDNFNGVLVNYNFSDSGIVGVSDEILINCTAIRNNNFESSKFKKFIFPQLTSMGVSASATLGENFYNCQQAELISMKKCKIIYGSSYNNFLNLKIGCKIEVNIDLLTYNSGNPAGDLLYAKNNRGAIVEFYDDDGNYVSTL